jgi:HD-GYP domain-containing protein (c-di-GMP phosphodiesterase class II)
MTNDRPYRASMPPRDALAELRQDVQRGWRNAQLVDAWTEVAESDGFGRVEGPGEKISKRA